MHLSPKSPPGQSFRGIRLWSIANGVPLFHFAATYPVGFGQFDRLWRLSCQVAPYVNKRCYIHRARVGDEPGEVDQICRCHSRSARGSSRARRLSLGFDLRPKHPGMSQLFRMLTVDLTIVRERVNRARLPQTARGGMRPKSLQCYWGPPHDLLKIVR